MAILIVEDDAIIAMTIEEALGDCGLPVAGPVPTARAALAVAAAGKFPIDLAILDIDLADGKGAGIALAHQLRNRWRVPSLILSARPEAAPIRDAAIGYIGKPCGVDAVAQSASAALSILAGEARPDRLPFGLRLFI